MQRSPRKSRARCCARVAVAALCLMLTASVRAEAPPNGYAANSDTAPGHCGTVQLTPGLIIDARNVANYECYLAAAAIEAVKHGFKIRIVGTHKLDWPMGFTQATEKYSPQAHLDSEGNMLNYVAGMPFPLVNVYDPKAARKIAYNWHMGPFMPDDFSLAPWGSFAYSDAAISPKPIYSEPDYTFVCAQFSFLRFAHRTEVDPRPTLGPNSQEFEWKALCTNWNVSEETHGGQSIWLRFLDPHHGDESFNYNSTTRRVRRSPVDPPYLNHDCRGCHQPYWAYALPKTEAYSYRLLGTTPILSCMTADDEPAGLVGRDEKAAPEELLTGGETLAMGEEPFEMRSAYIIEMIPTDPNYASLRTLVWIDTETYVWLGAEFFESDMKTETPELQEVAVPLWRTRPAPEGGNLFDLAGSFYVPLAYQPALPAHPDAAGLSPKNAKRWFFRSVTPSLGGFAQGINTGDLDDSKFNPRSLGH